MTNPRTIRQLHNLSAEAALEHLAVSEAGLSADELYHRQMEYGPNRLPTKADRSAFIRFVTQFNNVLIYVLFASACASLLLQHQVDAGVIFAVIFVNGLVGFIQEGKAEQALRAIMSMSRSRCNVIRDGQMRSADSADLVPGDIIVLQAGDRVPADARLLYCKELRCDESTLTGESKASTKSILPVALAAPLGERLNMVFMGTMVTYGTARAVISHTGPQTELGTISDLVAQAEISSTPLQKQLTRFAHHLSAAIILLAGVVVTYGYFIQDMATSAVLQAAIGIAVASIPEGLPAVVTIALAIGVQIMARQHALVRRLPSVEVLGSVDIICSDKTGTLTTNAMTARALITASEHYLLSGEGYRPQGELRVASTGIPVLYSEDAALEQMLWVARNCNDANITEGSQDWELHGDPTEGALLVLALKLNPTIPVSTRTDELPFDTEMRYMATLHPTIDDKKTLAIKGAPERLLMRANSQLQHNGPAPLNVDYWHKAIAELGAEGMRVMALACKIYTPTTKPLRHEDIEQGITFLGLVGISDPPRREAIASINTCRAAGIRIKMITGDNPTTACAIGAELGLSHTRVLTGAELDAMSPEELCMASNDIDIFARTSPLNKLQLVQALQAQGHVVAMTGDGVNDAPALKQADIGIAMGKRGTDAAKEAADIVLTDDNFSTITQAVAEGRTVYNNIVKSILFILPTSLAEAAIIVIAILFNTLLPITPAQILWINMVTAITLALALVFEPGEEGQMQQPPRPLNQGLITQQLLLRMILVGLSSAAIVFGLFHYYLDHGADVALARSVAVNALVFIEAFYLLNCRFLYTSLFTTRALVGSGPSLLAITGVLLAQLGFTYLPFSQRMFDVSPLALVDWFIIASASASIVIIVEAEKYWRKPKATLSRTLQE